VELGFSRASFAASQNLVCLVVADPFMKGVVAHHDGGGAATGEAFDEFDGVLAILCGLRAMNVRIEAQPATNVFVQFV
jgi:hypothetical protein